MVASSWWSLVGVAAWRCRVVVVVATWLVVELVVVVVVAVVGVGAQQRLITGRRDGGWRRRVEPGVVGVEASSMVGGLSSMRCGVRRGVGGGGWCWLSS